MTLRITHQNLTSNPPESGGQTATLPATLGASRSLARKLKEASGPLTSRALADMWCQDRGLTAKASTASMLRKRIGATLLALRHKGLVRQDGHVEGLIGWGLA